MKVYQTNSGLSYGQFAFLIATNIYRNKYLCIGVKNIHNHDKYKIGALIEDLDQDEVELSNFKIEDSELFGTYLFDFFLANYVMFDEQLI